MDYASNPDFKKTSEKDFKIEWFSGSGAGGQFRNKHQNSCRVIHIPTGISESRQARSREQNLIDAKSAILEKLKKLSLDVEHSNLSLDKKEKLGTGMRGDKILTLQFQNNKVSHHLTGKVCSIKEFMSGRMDILW